MSRFKQWCRDLAWWVLKNIHPAPDDIDAALRAAFSECGVNPDLYALDYDPGPKRYEVLHHAANHLGNPLRTVADLKRLLQ